MIGTYLKFIVLYNICHYQFYHTRHRLGTRKTSITFENFEKKNLWDGDGVRAKYAINKSSFFFQKDSTLRTEEVENSCERISTRKCRHNIRV